jgi:hypothetical protein
MIDDDTRMAIWSSPLGDPDPILDTVELHGLRREKMPLLTIAHRLPCRKTSRRKCDCALIMFYRPVPRGPEARQYRGPLWGKQRGIGQRSNAGHAGPAQAA